MLRQSEDRSLRCIVPENNIRVIAPLARGKKMALIGNSETGDLIVMSSQEVLRMRIRQGTLNDRAASNEHVVLSVRM